MLGRLTWAGPGGTRGRSCNLICSIAHGGYDSNSKPAKFDRLYTLLSSLSNKPLLDSISSLALAVTFVLPLEPLVLIPLEEPADFSAFFFGISFCC